MKKIINKTFALEDKIYHSWTDVIIGDDDYFKKFLKKNGIEGDEINLNWQAETGTFQDQDGRIKGYYIRIPEIDFTKDNYCTIVHELTHLSMRVLDAAGVKYDTNNQEPLAYLIEMFFSDFLTKAMKIYKR